MPHRLTPTSAAWESSSRRGPQAQAPPTPPPPPPSNCCAICICAICGPCPSRTCRSTSGRRSCWRRSGCWTRWWARAGAGSATNSTARSGRCSARSASTSTLLAARGCTGTRGGWDSVRPSRAAGADGGRGRVAGRRRVRGAQSPSAGVRGARRAGGSRRHLPDRRGGAGRGGSGGRQGRGAQYRLETRPRVLGDFVAGAWWHSTSPRSHFTQSLVCSRVTEDGGRITLSGRHFKVTAATGRGRSVSWGRTRRCWRCTGAVRGGTRPGAGGAGPGRQGDGGRAGCPTMAP